MVVGEIYCDYYYDNNVERSFFVFEIFLKVYEMESFNRFLNFNKDFFFGFIFGIIYEYFLEKFGI